MPIYHHHRHLSSMVHSHTDCATGLDIREILVRFILGIEIFSLL